MPLDVPDKMTVAGPVSEASAMSWTGRRFISVKYPVSNWMALASTMPMNTAPSEIQRGLPL